MGVDYGFEKFYSGLHYAIGSTDSVQKRLEGVLSGVAHLGPDSFPGAETWGRFTKMMKDCTRTPARTKDEGTLQATTSQMTNEEAAKWLEEALSIFSAIAEAQDR